MDRDRPTLDQIPKTAAIYYSQSERAAPYTWILLGKDAAGRRVYQKYLGDEAVGEPMALLNYNEFKRRVKLAAANSRSIGVPRWVEPYDFKKEE